MSEEFMGFERPTRNYYPMPNRWIDICAEINSLAELKVIQYVLRHTWGYHEYGTPKHITTDEFMYGRKRKDGSRIDKGTGLSNRSVIDGLRLAEQHGYLVSTLDDSDKARKVKAYALKMAEEEKVEEKSDVKNLHISYEQSSHRYEASSHQREESTHRSEKHTSGKTLVKKETRDTHRPASSKAPTSSKPQEPDVCVSSSFSNQSFSQGTNSQQRTETQEKAPLTDLELAIIAAWEKERHFPLNRNAGKFREQLAFVVSLIEQHLMTLEDMPALIKKAENDNYTRRQKSGLNFAIFVHLLGYHPEWFQQLSGSQEPADDLMACFLENLITSQPETVVEEAIGV